MPISYPQMFKMKIKILIAEHNDEDLAMLEQVLRKGGIDYEATIVKNEADYCIALTHFIPDIIISEFIFPSFDGPTAYKLKMELAAHTPFIFVCGEIGEENCVGYIDNGVTDYILKDRMFSLPAKIKRALKETTIRKQKEKFENELLKSEARLIEAQSLSKVGSWETNLTSLEVIWSAEACHIFGVEPEKFVASHPQFLAFVHPDDLADVNAAFAASFTNNSINKIEHRITTPAGDEKIVEERWQILCNEQGLPFRAVGTCQDITARKKAEEDHEFERRNKEALINSTEDLIWSVDTEIKLVAANNAFLQSMEAATGAMLKPGDELLIPDIFPTSLLAFWKKCYRRTLAGESFKEETYSPQINNSPASWRDATFNPIIKDEKVIGIACYSRNITATRIAEEKIIESELRYRSLIEHASDAICIVDTNLKFIEINNSACQQSGYTREEFLELSVLDILFAEDLTTIPLKIPTITPGTTFIQERRLKKKDGTALVMELSGKMMDDRSVLIFIRDISERNKAAQLISESEAKYRAFFENSMDGILLTVSDGSILAANPAASEIFQMTEAEICTAGRMGLVDLSDPRVMALIKERQNTGSARGEVTLVRKDGSRFAADVSTVLFKDAYGQERNSMIIRDVSERKSAEILLKEMNSHLKEQAKELALSNAELEQFAYVASHDLQEPLRMVSSFLSLLATRYENIIDDNGKKYINFAVDGAERMRMIILNLLEFSRVGRTADNLELIDLNGLTKDIKILFQKEIEDKKAIITVDPLPTIYSYTAPVTQVFQNLIGNALKYTRQGVLPKIHISVKELNDQWQFAVADNGIGISNEYFNKIFIIFQRLHNNKEFSGTGIGLAITKKIIEMQGGKIWLTSEEGKGSIFYFTIKK